MIIFKRLVLIFLIFFIFTNAQAESKKFNMVFVPASEKGDESDFASLISIVEDLTGFEINTIKVTDYNAAVEAMRAGRAHIAWYGGKTYIKAAEIAGAEAFAAGVKHGEKDAGYFAYFVVKKDSNIKKFSDVKGKVLSLNSIGSTSGDPFVTAAGAVTLEAPPPGTVTAGASIYAFELTFDLTAAHTADRDLNIFQMWFYQA